ncbi:hypothetical protein PFISCL1PPCAC_7974, partial [Pristionchus fissidentatus]
TALIVRHISAREIRDRHVLGLKLSERFASAENVRATRLYLPCVLNETLCFCALFSLAIYSSFYTQYSLGKDPTKLSHVYDLIGAFQSLFTPVFLFYRRRQLRRGIDHLIIVDRSIEADRYFQDLIESW